MLRNTKVLKGPRVVGEGIVISLFIIISVNLTGVCKVYLDVNAVTNADLNDRLNANETAVHDLSLVKKYYRQGNSYERNQRG